MSNGLKSLRLKQLAFALAFLTASGGSAAARAQDNAQQGEPSETSRQIQYSDFTKKRRPAAPNKEKPSGGGGDSAAWNAAPTYNRVRPTTPVRRRRRPRPNNPAPPKPPRPNTVVPPRPQPEQLRDVGVTLWRLRPARRGETGPGFQVVQDGETVFMTPERIAGTSHVNLGDRVRITVESPSNGYLYVINREQYEDGSTGPPALIFPVTAIREGDNKVSAGRLIDIPDAGDNPPFFRLTTKRRPGQPQPVGELITVLITARPLQGITPGPRPFLLRPELVAQWENDWEGDVVELLEMDGGAGRAWTMEEKLAGQAARDLSRVDPSPQTIYRVSARPNEPLMVTVQLLYGEPDDEQ